MSSTPTLEDLSTGYRGCLTPSQSRALLQLWSRFFAACTVPPVPVVRVNDHRDESVSASAKGSASASAGGTLPKSRSHRSFASTRERLVRGSVVKSSSSGAPGKRNASAPGSAGSASPATSSCNASVPELLTYDSATPANAAALTISPPGSSLGGAAAGARRAASLSTSTGNNEQAGGVEDLASGAHIPRDDAAKDTLRMIEEAKEMRIFLDRYGGAKLREVFWRGLVKGEHPDAVMLRFLRSRKWDVERALNVIGSTARFRVENDVDTLLKHGELGMIKTRGGYNILYNGISYVYGATAAGEPVYVIEVGSHYSSNQTQLELQRGVIYLQEWLSLLMPPPVERKVVIFNMSKFGLRNMDWWCVFFMVKTIERFYPESLSRVFVHCPPWIFRPIWFILKPLLDPVVRDKVRLTSSSEELEDLIPWDHLPRDTLGGGADWEYSWPAAQEGENDVQADTKTAGEKMDAFFEAAARFEKATREYIRLFVQACSPRQRQAFGSMTPSSSVTSPRLRSFSSHVNGHGASSSSGGGAGLTSSNGYGSYSYVSGSCDGADSASFTHDHDAADFVEPEGAQEMRGRRDVLATKLRVAFLELWPYFVGTSKYDRWGVMRRDGTIRWAYRKLDGSVEEQLLGKNASLPVLKAGLELIEQAECAAQEAEAHARSEKAARKQQRQAAAGGGSNSSSAARRREWERERQRTSASERPKTAATMDTAVPEDTESPPGPFLSNGAYASGAVMEQPVSTSGSLSRIVRDEASLKNGRGSVIDTSGAQSGQQQHGENEKEEVV
ncbi:hypothetical protein K437DRAFT_255949 [Tilletiaria anomala UBC 951]|uniref:CRAL-TRIO domain-containing protein n=1 Tax=Tilletiaria anomala (strain ATCC 24038 / CBS 436.72 / UBC 951) TaxID=1037660 RepID=A0A066W3M4_TILAU|nr:uncharacterized protein K437DRAFT_255949 [Tilletiaria anomala UBC 951]KDN47158.1 hypothetical protein K437DRAFT_255949 [Tilletiaria anomala UBC 951]